MHGAYLSTCGLTTGLAIENYPHVKALHLLTLFAITLDAVAQAEPDANQESPPPSLRYKLDGCSADWRSFRRGWIEETLGFEGISKVPRGKGIAFKGCHYDNDQNYLYLFFMCTPTVQQEIERHRAEHGESSFKGQGLASLWIDVDGNNSTGASASKTTGLKVVTGSEIYIPLSCGIFWQSDRGAESRGNFLEFSVSKWNSEKNAFADAVSRYSTRNDTPFIGHGVNGVEMAIPLKDLNLNKGDRFALSLWESNMRPGDFTRRIEIEIK